MRHHAESQSRMNLAALAQQESTSAHSDGRERRYGSVENLKQTELRLLQTPSRATVSPIHLTTENNNVFNLTADEMEHAIPISSASASVPVSERTRLLESHRASHSDGMHLQQPQQHQQQNQQQYQPREMGLDSVSHLSFPHTPEEEANCWEFYTADVVVILVLYVVNKVGQELVISSIPLVTQAEFSWSRQSGGYYMAAVGASVLPMILLINKFMKDVEERDLVLYLSYASLACLLVLLHCDWLGAYTLLQYIVGSALLFASLNALEGVIMALLAKLISPELAKGTFNSGLLATEAGTFGRVLGDVFITLFGGAHPHETVVNALFIPVAGMIMMSVALVWFYYDRLL